MKFIEITEDKKRFLPLLLAADEQEDMIDRYLERGEMYVLYDDNDGGDTMSRSRCPKAQQDAAPQSIGGVRAECVVTNEGNDVLEIKSLAVAEVDRGKGYGRAIIEFIAENYKDNFVILQVGTGDSPLTVPFYEKCGFARSGVIKDFFTENYDHPIYEGGVMLRDMIILQRKLR